MVVEDTINNEDYETEVSNIKTLKSNKPSNKLLDIKSVIFSFLIAILIFLAFNLLGFKNVSVNGKSMTPTLHDGDKLILNSLFYSPSAQDIVVFKPNSNKSELYIKRIIATEGQQVYIEKQEKKIYIDGVLLEDSFAKESKQMNFDIENPVIVPKDHYFVMGDNRDGSLDSRYKEVGMVNKENILGKVVFRFWPLNRIGIF